MIPIQFLDFVRFVIDIKGCEDYEKKKHTFARMESDCTLRFVPPGGALLYRRLLGMCRWMGAAFSRLDMTIMGSHFQ